MKGKLYGIGTGPGDPELLTIKAINTIKKCNIVAVPDSDSGERTAFAIVEQYLNGKDLLECRFTMEHDIEKRKASRQSVAEAIMHHLDDGMDVGFITLGDPATYSTYMYVHRIIAAKGYCAEIIPGITSYSAAAAQFGVALCEGSETLTIIPASHNNNIGEWLRLPGSKVVMKSGKSLNSVLEQLKKLGYDEHTKIASRVTMDGQRLFNSITAYENTPEAGYFTIAIVKENHETTP